MVDNRVQTANIKQHWTNYSKVDRGEIYKFLFKTVPFQELQSTRSHVLNKSQAFRKEEYGSNFSSSIIKLKRLTWGYILHFAGSRDKDLIDEGTGRMKNSYRGRR